ncbi:polymeric immunoglobulin receptor isoform X1 [Amia ocellicauda]|uniref:polymeric immunoglobulin receptor isoform X1 n=2 Tax=Amia ocellicauda TaxID=2972642 RepID=UPI003463BB93
MGSLITVCLGLLLSVMVTGLYVSGPDAVTGVEGGTVDIECQYASWLKHYDKIWCFIRSNTLCINRVTTSVGHGTMSLKDDKENRRIHISMTQLKKINEGNYHCEIGRFSVFFKTVKLNIRQVTGPEIVIGTVGGSLSVDCMYSQMLLQSRKCCCKLPHGFCTHPAEVNAGDLKGSVTLQDFTKYRTLTLTINNLAEEDAGKYRFEFDQDEVHEVELKVFAKPGLRVPETVTGMTGDRVEILCEYSQEHMNKEKYWCKWKYGECKKLLTELNNNTELIITDYRHRCTLALSMSSLTEGNGGKYQCIVKDSEGHISKEMELKIVAIRGPDVVNGFSGGSVTIQCQYSDSYKDSNKFWCKVSSYGDCEDLQNIHINYAQRNSFTVFMNNLRQEDTGQYRCGLRNNIRHVFYADIYLNVFPGPSLNSTVRPHTTIPTTRQHTSTKKTQKPTKLENIPYDSTLNTSSKNKDILELIKNHPIAMGILGILVLLMLMLAAIAIKRALAKASGSASASQDNGGNFRMREVQTTPLASDNVYTYHSYFQPAVTSNNVNVHGNVDEDSTDSSETSDSSCPWETRNLSRNDSSDAGRALGSAGTDQIGDYVNVSEQGWIDREDYVNMLEEQGPEEGGAPEWDQKGEDDYVNVKPPLESEDSGEEGDEEGADGDSSEEQDDPENDDDDVQYTQVVFK